MFVGGFIAGSTELLTTGIKVELDKNNIDVAIGLALILLALVFGITLAINVIQRRRK
jgi:ABC-type tungstate transport system substrate-binding protein